MKRKIVFLTGTRADFGKLKSLIRACEKIDILEVTLFVTGMHMHTKYGSTVNEIEKCKFSNTQLYKFINSTSESSMDKALAKTINGLSDLVKEITPDLIIIHGDRIEALAGAIVGSLNNILVAHIEGGEVSGTIDELIRHSVSKLSHLHFVANHRAKKRLMQMGEYENNIFEIGSPDIDIMFSPNLPSLHEAKLHYEIPFNEYAVLAFHPVTTEFEHVEKNTKELVNAVKASNQNYIVIYPNNDMGSSEILREYEILNNDSNFMLFPSLRFEYFLVLLKNAKFIIGNSSAGIREAPYYGLPTVNIGTRQSGRSEMKDIIQTSNTQESIIEGINKALETKLKPVYHFGEGNSDKKFIDILSNEKLWFMDKQKRFVDSL